MQTRSNGIHLISLIIWKMCKDGTNEMIDIVCTKENRISCCLPYEQTDMDEKQKRLQCITFATPSC